MSPEFGPPPTGALETLEQQFPYMLRGSLTVSGNGCKCGSCGRRYDTASLTTPVCEDVSCGVEWFTMVVEDISSNDYPPIAIALGVQSATTLLRRTQSGGGLRQDSHIVHGGKFQRIEDVKVVGGLL